jgi:hypothetical protein
MKFMHSARWLLMALLLPLVIAPQARAGVYISVGFAPPVLPVYVQPPCPEPNLMWMPGYWAYDYDSGGYYWVPGAWVPAPYEGALWTPPYWGWEGGVYIFHPGYWGWHVGYYGGVNYGFGYMGIGFVGGEWRGHAFAYNTAIVRVNETVIRNVYVNKTIVNQTTIVNNNRVSYNGGPGGIVHRPTPAEQVAQHEQHLAPTRFQEQHVQAARSDRNSFAKVNGGHPQTVAVARPLPSAHIEPPAPAANAHAAAGVRSGAASANSGARGEYRPAPAPQPNSRQEQQSRPAYRPAPEPRPTPESHPAPRPEYHPAPRPTPESHPAPRPEPRPESRPEPKSKEPNR